MGERLGGLSGQACLPTTRQIVTALTGYYNREEADRLSDRSAVEGVRQQRQSSRFPPPSRRFYRRL